MIGDVGNHRHMRGGAREDRLVDAVHVGGDKAGEGLDASVRSDILKGNDNAQACDLQPAQRRARRWMGVARAKPGDGRAMRKALHGMPPGAN